MKPVKNDEVRAPYFPRFVREEEGVVTIFTVYLLLMILMVAGIGADLMHNEMRRTALQNTVDRAVLAAADLDQTLQPTQVVEDYFDKAGLGDYLTSVVPNSELNYRNVSATAFTSSPTQFMRLFGVDSLPVPAASQAIEEVPNVEISLVLDISGSMRFSNRMDNLRPAASNFIDIVLFGAAANTTSINLIPYAGHTNPGAFMFNRLNGVRYSASALDEADGGINEAFNNTTLPVGDPRGTGPDGEVYVYPNVSSCMEIQDSDFSFSTLPAAATYAQTPHFMNWSIAADVMDWGWCPQDQTSIVYASNNSVQLKGLINSMRMHDGTGTHYAMKWALALLNPATKPHFEEMAKPANNLIPAAFGDRPLPFDDTETVKYIILMTDGQITQQYRPKVGLETHVENPTVVLNDRKTDRRTITTANDNVQSFYSQCNLAKDPARNVIIYTIAFEAPGTPETQMKNCASSDSHFFRATGKAEIDAAFSAIARQINELRLTQ